MSNAAIQRGVRILIMTDEMHSIIDHIYEALVDEEYNVASEDVKYLIRELKKMQKLIDDNDF